MASVQYIDTFAYWALSLTKHRWHAKGGAPVLITTGGPFAGDAYLETTQVRDRIERSFDTNSSWVQGSFRLRYREEMAVAADDQPIASLYANDLGTLYLAATLHLLRDGKLRVKDGLGNTVVTSATAVCPFDDAWRTVEWRVATWDDTATPAGETAVLVNDAAAIAATVGDFRGQKPGSPINLVNYLVLGGVGTATDARKVDLANFVLYAGGTGTVRDFPDWLHRGYRVHALRPNGAGEFSGWTVTGAVNNWEAVDDTSPDDSTTRVSASADNTRDLYAVEDLPAGGGKILVVQEVYRYGGVSGGFRNVAPIMKYSGTQVDGPTVTATGGFEYDTQPFRRLLDPLGAVWSAAAVNALQIGQRIVGTSGSGSAAVTQTYIEVLRNTPTAAGYAYIIA